MPLTAGWKGGGGGGGGGRGGNRGPATLGPDHTISSHLFSRRGRAEVQSATCVECNKCCLQSTEVWQVAYLFYCLLNTLNIDIILPELLLVKKTLPKNNNQKKMEKNISGLIESYLRIELIQCIRDQSVHDGVLIPTLMFTGGEGIKDLVEHTKPMYLNKHWSFIANGRRNGK